MGAPKHRMRVPFLLSRFGLRQGSQRLNLSFLRSPRLLPTRIQNHSGRSLPITRNILLAALSPAAFVKLSEEGSEDGKTGEEHMLEASRADIEDSSSDDVFGPRRAWRGVFLLVDHYVYEPIATGLRFLHLFIIFIPVIFAVPAMWFGRRQRHRDNERSGTIWWYGFFVHSMERAGPAFIKVHNTSLII